MTSTKKKLIVVSGPTGSGKNTIMSAVMRDLRSLEEIVTMTTRPRRKGERDGREYHFASERGFKRRIHLSTFLEWAVVHGNYYGTPKREVQRIQNSGNIPVLIIDVQGALAVKKQHPYALLIFLKPTPWLRYRARLRRDRGGEKNFDERLQSIAFEMRVAEQYDRIVPNREGSIGKTIVAVERIIQRYIEAI